MKQWTFLINKFATVSPLAEQLFMISGVTRVFYGNNFISVSKGDQVEWDDLQENIQGTIETYYDKDQPLLTGEAAEGTHSQLHPSQEVMDDDSEAVAMIKEILASRVRPFVKEDGGDVAFIDFDEESGVVTLLMKGSWAGCPSSGATLKGGIENMMKHYVAEVTEVVGIDDMPE